MSKEIDKVFDEADVLIIAGRCLGMSYEATGDWVCTPSFPAGVSEKTVRNRIANNREAYDRLLSRIGVAFKKKEEEIEEISREKYREKLQKLRGKAVRVKELALDHAINNAFDVKALTLGAQVAESVEDRDLGKASQVHKVEGGVHHVHTFNPQPIRQLLGQEVDMVNSNRLLNSLPKDVIDAKVVPS